MALRWNEFDDALGYETPGTPVNCGSTVTATSLSSSKPRRTWSGDDRSRLQSGMYTSDGCDVSGADETDCTQDDGYISMPGDDYQTPHTALSDVSVEQLPANNKLEGKSLFDTTRRRAGSKVQERRLMADVAAARRRRSVIASDGHDDDDVIQGVWGLNWGGRGKKAWASAMQSPVWQRLSSFCKSARGGIFATRKEKRGGYGAEGSAAASRTAAAASLLQRKSTSDTDDADSNVSACESEPQSVPMVRVAGSAAEKTRAGGVHVRSIRSVGQGIQRVASRATELAVTVGEKWKKRRVRLAKAQRGQAPHSSMILLPGGAIRRAWDCLGLCLVLLVILVQVIKARWESHHKGWMFFDVEHPYQGVLLQLQVLQDVFFIVDIFVNFRTAYVDEATGRYVRDPWRIASHYSRHWLICDLLCALPLDMLVNESLIVATETPRRKGPKRWFKQLLRRTGVLHMLRSAAAIGPFRGARRVGKCFVHGRRILRAFGLLQTIRGVNTVKQVLSLSAALKGFAVLRDLGVLRFVSWASMTSSTLVKSFAFLRLLLSLTVRGWEEGFNAIRAGGAYVQMLISRQGGVGVGGGGGASDGEEKRAAAVDRKVDKASSKLKPGLYQNRGRNPLASPLNSLANLLKSASKGRAKGAKNVEADVMTHDASSDDETREILHEWRSPDLVLSPAEHEHAHAGKSTRMQEHVHAHEPGIWGGMRAMMSPVAMTPCTPLADLDRDASRILNVPVSGGSGSRLSSHSRASSEMSARDTTCAMSFSNDESALSGKSGRDALEMSGEGEESEGWEVLAVPAGQQQVVDDVDLLRACCTSMPADEGGAPYNPCQESLPALAHGWYYDGEMHVGHENSGVPAHASRVLVC